MGHGPEKICSSWLCFEHRGGTSWSPEVHANLNHSVILHKKTGKWNHESWVLGKGELLWSMRPHVLDPLLSAPCLWHAPRALLGLRMLSHTLLCARQFFVLCTSPGEHQSIPFHDQSHRLKLQPQINRLVMNKSCDFPFNFTSVSVSSSYLSVRVNKNQELNAKNLINDSSPERAFATSRPTPLPSFFKTSLWLNLLQRQRLRNSSRR